MRPLATLRLLVLVALLAAPAALAQERTPVLLERVDDGELVADVASPGSAVFHLFNLNPSDDFYVSVRIDAPEHWIAEAEPRAFLLAPRGEQNVTIELRPEDVPRTATASFTATFSLVNTGTGEVTSIDQTVIVASGEAPRVLGFFPNPLGPPLDNAIGTFLLSMAFWVLVAVATMVAGNALVRVVMTRASDTTTKQVIQKLQKPIFLFVFFLGLADSFALLPRNPLIVLIEKILIAVAVTIFGMYVIYRLLDAGLTYYQREIAPRTQTNLDDILLPVLRRVGLTVIYIAGIIITLKRLGWDPTILFAGAGIAGLVIAFAAQDTFSNLFSGVFLMLDRPFVEGDIILLETGEVARVDKIGLRTTDLYEYDHHHTIVVPNNHLATRRVVNYSAPDSNFKTDIFLGTAYASDIRKVREILLAVANDHAEVVKGGVWDPQVQLRDFADSQMTFMLRVTLRDPRDKNRIPSELRAEIKRRFDAAGIEIPFPQRVVHMRPA